MGILGGHCFSFRCVQGQQHMIFSCFFKSASKNVCYTLSYFQVLDIIYLIFFSFLFYILPKFLRNPYCEHANKDFCIWAIHLSLVNYSSSKLLLLWLVYNVTSFINHFGYIYLFLTLWLQTRYRMVIPYDLTYGNSMFL